MLNFGTIKGGARRVEPPKGGAPNPEKVGPRRGALKGGAQEGGAQKGGAQKGEPRRVEPRRMEPRRVKANVEPRRVDPRRVEAPKGGGPKFRAFFPSSRHNFLSSFSLWGSSRGILVVFEAPGP